MIVKIIEFDFWNTFCARQRMRIKHIHIPANQRTITVTYELIENTRRDKAIVSPAQVDDKARERTMEGKA